MTKQEEIREWLWNKVGFIRKEGSVPSKNKRFMDYDTEEILEYLHSAGCVLKVERELPYQCICEEPDRDTESYPHSNECYVFNNYHKAGYVAVEPLLLEDTAKLEKK